MVEAVIKKNSFTGDNKYMVRKFQTIISASAASLLAISAMAQNPPAPKTDVPDQLRDQSPRVKHENHPKYAAKASDILGATVVNNHGEKLGKVDDLAVDVESGRIVQVILSTGGFLGIGNTLSAVPPGALHCESAQTTLRLDTDREKLSAAPKFEMSKWADYSDTNHLAAVYLYYGEEPAFHFIQAGDASADALTNTVPTRRADGTWDKIQLASGTQCMIPASRLGQIQRASKFIGTTVKNLQDDKLGNVENLILDLPSGHITAVIVSSGGFLGIDEELSPIPPTAFGFSADRNTLQLDITKAALSNAPHFKSGQWPDFTQPEYAPGVYRAYNIEPYFAPKSKSKTQPDTTSSNIRDRDSRTLTPLDQGNSQADIDTTAQIRKGIIATKDMSVNAKNVKIITRDGQVTLRGPVNTSEEKRLIGEIANGVATSESVHNQLEVTLAAANNN